MSVESREFGTALSPIARIGRVVLSFTSEVGRFTFVLGRTVAPISRLELDRYELLRSLHRFGVRSVPIVLATAIFTGAIMTLQSIPYVTQMQAKRLLPWASAFATLREVAPVLIGLMFSGRVGSNNTAELATMKVTEQFEAMRALVLDPYKLLIAPRFVAMVVVMVALTILGDVFAIGGSMVIAAWMADLEPVQFLALMREQVRLQDFLSGVAKAAVFGALIAVTSSMYGLYAKGGAVGVGRAVNASVVGSALGIIVLDFMVTAVWR